MGCVSFPFWIGIVLGTVTLAVTILIVVINRKWKSIHFFMFMRFNVLISHDEEPETVEDLEFDAFVIYRWVRFIDCATEPQTNNIYFKHSSLIEATQTDGLSRMRFNLAWRI